MSRTPYSPRVEKCNAPLLGKVVRTGSPLIPAGGPRLSAPECRPEFRLFTSGLKSSPAAECRQRPPGRAGTGGSASSAPYRVGRPPERPFELQLDTEDPIPGAKSQERDVWLLAPGGDDRR